MITIDTKITQLDSALADERVNNRFECTLDDLFSLLLREVYLFRNRTDDVFLGHSRLLLALRRPN